MYKYGVRVLRSRESARIPVSLFLGGCSRGYDVILRQREEEGGREGREGCRGNRLAS